jgi:hypothetical protein
MMYGVADAYACGVVTMSESVLVKVGWVSYLLVWVLLLANIARDWVTQGWISPLSMILLAILAGGTLSQRLRGEPIISVQGASRRLIITLILTLAVTALILIYTLLIA